MRVRRSTKRLHYEDWRPWQKELYEGVHASIEWVPAYNARGYKFRPAPPPVPVPVPQVELRMEGGEHPKRLTIWAKIKRAVRGS